MPQLSHITDFAGLLTRILDVGEHFTIYFCVQEKGLAQWAIRPNERRPRHVLYVPESDPLEGTVEGKLVRVEPGQVLWVQPNVLFDLTAISPTRNISLGVCRFDMHDTRVMRLPEDFYIGMRPDGDGILEELLPRHEAKTAIDQLRHRAVLARVLCRTFIEPLEQQVTGLSMPVRRRLLEFMTKNIRQRFGIRELAAEVGMNPSYLSRQFHLSFGSAPRAYIMQLRIHHASSYLLASDDSIAAVAERFGYDGVFLFSRQFHQVMGRSPSAWRKRQGAR
ncbi:MAG: AraC family transcriptional regulator [Planctomycetota bacterium]